MEFKGTINTSQNEFKSPGEGNHIMGLVSIKDCTMKFKDAEKSGIQFNFRLAADPDCVVCHRVTTSLNPKSNLYKTLRRMAPKQVTEATNGEEAKQLLSTLENRWYDVAVVEVNKDGKVYANVDDCLIKPAPDSDCPKDPPDKYFAGVAKSKPSPAPKAAPAKGKEKDLDDIPF